MMTASDLFHAGRLQDAIAAQTTKVKSSPTDQPARFFLFEMLLFAGDLDRARKQLDMLKYDDPAHSAAVMQYRMALDAETKRRAVFAGTEEPKGLAVAPDHVKLRLEAITYMAKGEHAEAQKKLDEANAATPLLKGMLNGKEFEGFGDADERFGTIIEVFGSGGVYSWVPLEAVVSITLNPPAHPRDVIWRPAQIVMTDGLEGDVLIPGLYPNSFEHPDEAVKLGQATDWVETPGQVTRGVGGKCHLTANGSIQFNDILQLMLAHAAAE